MFTSRSCHVEPPESTSESLPNGPQFGLSRALENFKSAVLRVAAVGLKRPLTSEEVGRIEKNVAEKSNILSHTPDHPPYAAMILTALQELNEEGGSSEESISNFIIKEFTDLSWFHSAYLKHHLHNLCDSGEILVNSENRYLLVDENAPTASPKSDNKPNAELRRRRGRSRKRYEIGKQNKVKEKMGPNDLEIVVREVHNEVVEEHKQQIEEWHDTTEVIKELELKNEEREALDSEAQANKPMKIKLRLSRIRMKRDIGSELKASGTSDPNKETVKAKWSPAVHEIFVDVCLEETLKGNKLTTFFNEGGWKNIEENFYENSGLRYDRKQLKNHWDLTKGHWKTWSKLIRTCSMGWDPNTQTFAASEDDWANYIQANPDAAHYRFKVPFLADKLRVIFDGTTYNEDTQYTSLSTKRRKRRKINDCSTTNPVLPGNEIIEATPISQNNCLFDIVESKSIVTQSSQGKLSYSIGECIDCLDGMNEIEPGSDLYLFALDIFLKREFREVFLQLKRPSVRVAWLQGMQSTGPPLPLH